MSIAWISSAWKQGPADPIERYVYVAIGDNANDEGEAFPSLPTIADKTRLSLSTIRRAIASMEDSGWLEVTRGLGAGNRSHYRLKKVSEGKVSQRKLSLGKVSVRRKKGVTQTQKGVTQKNPPNPLIGVNVINRQEPLLAEREEGRPDDRHTPFRAATQEYWDSENPDIGMPWDGSEGKALSLLLKANPHLDLEAFKVLLRNRHQSEVSHAERPRKWLDRVTDYACGPLDRYGKPKEASNGTTVNRAQQRTNGNLAALAAATASLHVRSTSPAALGLNPETAAHDDAAQVAWIRRKQDAGEKVGQVLADYADRWERGRQLAQLAIETESRAAL